MKKGIFAKWDRSFWLLIYFGVMPSLFGTALAGYSLFFTDAIRHMGILGLMVINLLFSFVLALGLMPTTFYALLAGYMLGWESLPYLFLSYLLASSIGYSLCAFLDSGKLKGFLDQRFDMSHTMEEMTGTGVLLVAFCRMSPALPFAVLNAVFAIVRYPLPPYLIGSVLGMVPRTLFAVYVGGCFSLVTSFEDLKSETSLWFAVVIALLSFWGIGWIVKKKFLRSKTEIE